MITWTVLHHIRCSHIPSILVCWNQYSPQYDFEVNIWPWHLPGKKAHNIHSLCNLLMCQSIKVAYQHLEVLCTCVLLRENYHIALELKSRSCETTIEYYILHETYLVDLSKAELWLNMSLCGIVSPTQTVSTYLDAALPDGHLQQDILLCCVWEQGLVLWHHPISDYQGFVFLTMKTIKNLILFLWGSCENWISVSFLLYIQYICWYKYIQYILWNLLMQMPPVAE